MFRFAQSIIHLIALTSALALVVSPANAFGAHFPSRHPTYAPHYKQWGSFAHRSPQPYSSYPQWGSFAHYSPRRESSYSHWGSFARYSPPRYSFYPPQWGSFAHYSPRPHFFSPRPFDGGGNIMRYFANARTAGYGYGNTVIAGVCASACTMKLGSRNACIEPGATLLFHGASANGYRSELATRIMLDSYPSGIRSWAMRSGALNRNSPTELTGRQAIALGVRACRA